MGDPLIDFSGERLTPTENKKLRKIIRDKERMDWLMSAILVWSGYLSATIVAIWAVKDHLVKMFKALTSP